MGIKGFYSLLSDNSINTEYLYNIKNNWIVIDTSLFLYRKCMKSKLEYNYIYCVLNFILKFITI